jgi:hypothetical protein
MNTSELKSLAHWGGYAQEQLVRIKGPAGKPQDAVVTVAYTLHTSVVLLHVVGDFNGNSTLKVPSK